MAPENSCGYCFERGFILCEVAYRWRLVRDELRDRLAEFDVFWCLAAAYKDDRTFVVAFRVLLYGT